MTGFVKEGDTAAEAAGLRWIAVPGGPPVPALLTRTPSASPARSSSAANTFSAMGERQMLPLQTKTTCTIL